MESLQLKECIHYPSISSITGNLTRVEEEKESNLNYLDVWVIAGYVIT